MITVEDLRLTLEGRRILDGVTFEVARGEAVALVGANGSGKTSILRCLLGLTPCEGSIRVDGFDAARQPVQARGRLAYVPQRAGFGDATALEVVRLTAQLRGIPRARCFPALMDVGLAEAADRRVRTFSGGMHQRLLLAMALLCDAPVFLLDEPTASLDAAGQADFAEVVARLRREGRTLLIASHRDEETCGMMDRVLALESGRLVERPEPARGVIRLRRSVGDTAGGAA